MKWTPRARSAVQMSGLAALLLLLTGLLRGCDREDGGQRATEIIVKLREEGRRLRTVIANGDTTLFYGPDTLTIFNHLTDRNHLKIGQSYPRLSKRWQEEHGWRSGRDDSFAVQVLMEGCPGFSAEDRGAVDSLVDRWRGDNAVAKEDTAAIASILRLLKDGITSADSAKAADFIAAIQADGAVMGQRDSLAIPAMLRLLTECDVVAFSDSMAVLRFARRLEEDGGVGGVSSIAIPAILARAQSSPIGLRDSLAIVSWVRLIAGDDAFGSPDSLAAIDLFLRIRILSPEVDISRLLGELREISEIEYAVRAIPAAKAPPEGRRRIGLFGMVSRALAQSSGQEYQESAPVGVDALHAWTVNGGYGGKARVFVCDYSYWGDHEDLDDAAITPLGTLPISASKDDRCHGTKTLGVLVAEGNDAEVIGTSPSAQVFFSSVIDGGINEAIDRVVNSIKFDVGNTTPAILVIEAQLDKGDLPTGSGCGCNDVESQNYPQFLPVEVNPDNYTAIKTLVSDYKVAVVEAAGNGRGELGQVTAGTDVLWDPSWDPDSGAIIVGAGQPAGSALAPAVEAHARMVESNYGDRVDCQGWGDAVKSTTVVFDANGTPSGSYDTFTHTSAATAVVGATVASFQSAHFTKPEYGYTYLPTNLRVFLRDKDYGTPQPTGDEGWIGPLPSLKKLMEAFDIRPPS